MRSFYSVVIALSFVAVAACGGGQKTTPAAAVAADPCDTAAANVIKQMKLESELASLPPAAFDDLQVVVANSCRTDAWSAELQTCLGTAADKAAMDGCSAQLTPDQQASFGKAAMEVLAKHGAMGGGGYGGDAYGGAGYGGASYGG